MVFFFKKEKKGKKNFAGALQVLACVCREEGRCVGAPGDVQEVTKASGCNCWRTWWNPRAIKGSEEVEMSM